MSSRAAELGFSIVGWPYTRPVRSARPGGQRRVCAGSGAGHAPGICPSLCRTVHRRAQPGRCDGPDGCSRCIPGMCGGSLLPAPALPTCRVSLSRPPTWNLPPVASQHSNAVGTTTTTSLPNVRTGSRPTRAPENRLDRHRRHHRCIMTPHRKQRPKPTKSRSLKGIPNRSYPLDTPNGARSDP